MTLEMWSYMNTGLNDCNNVFGNAYSLFYTYNAPTWSQPFLSFSWGHGEGIHNYRNATVFTDFDTTSGIIVMVAASAWSCIILAALMLLTRVKPRKVRHSQASASERKSRPLSRPSSKAASSSKS